MSKARIFAGVVAAGLVMGWLAPPVAADGLSRFKDAMKDAPPGVLTYKNAKALGDNGFVLEEVTLTPPPDATGGAKAGPVPIKRITVEDFDFASIDKNVPPNFLKMRIEGIDIGPKPAEGIDLKTLTGLDKIAADFNVDYRVDGARKTMTLNKLELDLAGLARLEFSMVLDGVEADALDSTAPNATLRTASLVFEDRSLLGKSLPAAANAQGADAEGLVKMVKETLIGLRTGQGPATLAVLDALASYIEDYKQPKGALRISVSPTGKTSVASLGELKDPEAAVKALGLVISYPGTRSQGAAAPAAGSKEAAVAPGAGAGCTSGARLFVKHEDAWWSATVRDATRSGDKCVGRVDGNNDDLVFALNQTLAWSIDGPGKAATACKNGDKVLVAYKDGGWYPAKVTADAAATAKCPIKYDSDGDEEKVELKKVRRID